MKMFIDERQAQNDTTRMTGAIMTTGSSRNVVRKEENEISFHNRL